MTTNEAAIRASEVEKAVWAATKNFKGILNELQRRQIALDVVAHLSASVPDVDELNTWGTMTTNTGDENIERWQTPIGSPAQSPRVCMKCGHEQSVIQGRCVRGCGSHKCEFPT